MNKTLCNTEDRTFSNALAGIVGHLRRDTYLPRRVVPDGSLHADSVRCAGGLEEHLRYSEESLFPAFREVESGVAGHILELEQDHRLLQNSSLDLDYLIREGQRAGAYELARSFLAVLLDHLRRETEHVEEFLRCYIVSETGRVHWNTRDRRSTGRPGGIPDPSR